jgi:uncharacterized protein (DUF305 family)
MTIRRFRPAAMALLAAALVGGMLFAPARAENAPTPAEMQQQMQGMRDQMMAMQGQMLQMHQWMQQMMGRGMGYGMMGPGMMGPGMMGPGMMGQGGMGYGMMGPGGMMGYGMMDPDDMPGYGMMGQGGMGYGMMGATGGDADRNFVLMMQQHHRGEIAMAAAVAAETKDPEIKKLAETLQADHEKDLQALQDWLDKHR